MPNFDRAFQIIVHGRVQGVGFRYSTAIAARKHGICGWVRNDYDGTVEIFCEGTEEKLARFISWLKKGPPGAVVAKLDSKPAQAQGIYSSFTIEY